MLREKILLSSATFEQERSDFGIEMNMGSAIPVLSDPDITFAAVSLRLGSQSRHAHKVIRGCDPPRRQLRSLGSSITRFPKSSHCLGPAEDLFDSLSYPLTDRVALMACSAAVNSRTTLALGVGGHMGSDLSAPQKINKAMSVVVLIGSQRFDSHALSLLTLDHLLGCFPLRCAGGLTDFQIDQKPVSVLHQRMRPVAQLGLFARPLSGQKTLGIGLGLMGVVAALLTVKIHPTIARISLIFATGSIFSFGSKALEPRPCLDQRPVHTEMIVAHQVRFARLSDHCVEKQTPHLVFQQPIAVFAKDRGIETRFLKFHVQKPAKQQIVAQLLTELPLAAHRIQGDQQQRLQYLLGGNRRPSDLRIHPVKHPRQPPQFIIRQLLDPSKRMVSRYTVFDRNRRPHARLFILQTAHHHLPRLYRGDLNMRSRVQNRNIFKT